ncbi:Aste57867_16975 [Aphanomyces stellatus]|uniref:Aste57867_16975 protein n=1 Tax=Aphanomyces stellatus TaxID=120398 RepID=A0A485L7V4_9STRA|nr:hypothetical protein As57867_016917 [Aphanomyces stellatus]VFT93737.1 Aste57867_16975 [Aphanomyces stellatus]
MLPYSPDYVMPISSAIFVKKLDTMVQATPPHMGGWCLGGAAFSINAPTDFANELLPKYFKHGNLSSLVRQLNMYGFKKQRHEELHVTGNDPVVTYSHPFFQQHKPQWLARIRRKTAPPTPFQNSGSNVIAIRNQVSDIKRNLGTLSDQVHQLTSLVAKSLDDSQPSKLEKGMLWRAH